MTLEKGTFIQPEIITTIEKKRILEKCSSMNLEITALGAYASHLSKNRKKRQQTVEFVKKTIDLAVDLNVPNLVTVSGGTEMSTEKAWNILVGLFREEAAYAKDSGVKIALHPHVGNFILSPNKTIRLLNEVNSDHFRITFDGAHLYATGFDLIEATKILGKYTVHVHLMGVQGNRLGDRYPIGIEVSDLPNEEWLKALKEEGYNGAVAVRVPDFREKTVFEDRALSANEYLTKLLKRL